MIEDNKVHTEDGYVEGMGMILSVAATGHEQSVHVEMTDEFWALPWEERLQILDRAVNDIDRIRRTIEEQGQ